jgi:DNA polymerase I-like protein with 3'-5' exonuclease and polymerase domains
MEYVESQSVGIDGFARDYYGKKRFFGKDSYLIRNFAIQSPASTICLDKLVKIDKELVDARLAMHVHDGYVLYVRPSDCRKVYNLARDIMESDDDSLYPNLKLKISCEVGDSLNELKSI